MMHSRPLLLALLVLAAPTPAVTQDAPSAPVWNSERALELIGRAQARRAESNADTGLVNYQSDARLYVYFYLDRPDTGERNLVKTDQLALDVLWQAPDQVKQRIVGWRDQKSLPTNINYHLDHLTVVMENFGDEIKLGDGDEVRGVPHPAAAGAASFYDYRLADSLTLRLPGAPEPVRVYEVQVRPRDLKKPGFVGSVFVERRAGDIVRMDFTFTAAAYVDRYLDYINISLDNGLWRGRSWLPNEQRVEIRRRIPELDIPAGSVIRATMRVNNYRFNQPLPATAFVGPSVVRVPRDQAANFPFEQEIHEEVREEGIGPEVELQDVRRLALELARRQALQRVSGVRLSVPRASELLRFNRAEGLALGLAASVTPVPGLRARALGGWAFGAEHPFGSLRVQTGLRRTRAEASLFVNQPRDVGVTAGSGAANTLSALFAGQDYSDLFYATGASLSLRRELSAEWTWSAGVRAEHQESADLESGFSVFGGAARPVRAIDEAELALGASLGLRRTPAAEAGRWWGAELVAEGGVTNPIARDLTCLTDPCEDSFQGQFLKPQARLDWGRRWPAGDAELRLTGRAGAALGDLPRQELYLVGGRGTLPGYGFRRFGGDRFATLGATLSTDLARPWVRGRLLGGLGWADAGSAGAEALQRWGATPTGSLLPTLGVGLGLVHDILRVDLARGLGEGGRWELIVEANPAFWDFL